MNKKVCFVTSNFVGEKFKVPDIPGKFKRMKGCDYILFTNVRKEIFHNCCWDIREIDFPEINDCIIKSRIPKFQIWKIKEMEKYDIIVYCDAYWAPKYGEKEWNKLFNKILENESGIIQGKNPYRICAYEECDELIRQKKDSIDRMEKTKQFLEREALERNFGLWRNTFLAYDTKNEKVKILFDYLWDLFKEGKYTHRDQPLYSLAVMKTGIKPSILNLQPYFNMNGRISKHIYS